MRILLLWLTFAVTVVSGLLMCDLHLRSIWQTGPAVMVFTPCLAYLFFAYDRRIIAFPGRLMRNAATEEDVVHLEKTCSIALIFGGLGTILGMISVMVHLANVNELGTGVAAAYCSALYACFPLTLFLPLRKRDAATVKDHRQLKKAAGFMAVVTVMATSLLFTVLYAVNLAGVKG